MKNLHITSEVGDRLVNSEGALSYKTRVSSNQPLNQSLSKRLYGDFFERELNLGRGQGNYKAQRPVPAITNYCHSAGRGQAYTVNETRGLGGGYFRSGIDYGHASFNIDDCCDEQGMRLEEEEPGVFKMHKRFGSSSRRKFIDPYITANFCVACGQSGDFRCSRCKTWYCSRNCQVKDWPLHKPICKEVEGENDASSMKSSESCRESFQSQVSNTEDTTEIQHFKENINKFNQRRLPHMNQKEQNTHLKSEKEDKDHSREFSVKKQQQFITKETVLDQGPNNLDKPEFNKGQKLRDNFKEPVSQQNDKGYRYNNSRFSGKSNGKGYQKEDKESNSDYQKTDYTSNKEDPDRCNVKSFSTIQETKKEPLLKEEVLNVEVLADIHGKTPSISSDASGAVSESNNRFPAQEVETDTKVTGKEIESGQLEMNIVSKDEPIQEQLQPVSTPPKKFWLSDCSSINLPVGETIPLVVSTIVSPEMMFFHPVEEGVILKLQEIMKMVNENCNNLPDSSYLPETGEMCLAKYTDGLWYRAVALQLDKADIHIWFSDFGNSEMVATSDIRPIFPEVMEYPLIAQHCMLQDFLTKMEWTDENIQELRTCLPDSDIIMATILEKHPDNYYIVDIPSVRKHLIKKGLVRLTTEGS
ncbi:tudor domain-containing protein 1-like [Limulus polyphemus]|uniref:Tudor domain-containing protein 1-like n=1 Tax=Limulus polyphemus TaxID=6850 RepID=A0ABM1BWK4_LIMPO|nr:tudor domain-containing protein 1-like [Limulus polyphemus]